MKILNKLVEISKGKLVSKIELKLVVGLRIEGEKKGESRDKHGVLWEGIDILGHSVINRIVWGWG